MKRGGKIICSAAVIAVAACSGQPGTLQIRPMPTVLAAGERPVSFRVAEGWGQLALGNVGLALESFRKAVREEPASVEALAGIANCYDRMGRFDLARRHYEAALAIAPGDTQLLARLAGSLDLAGRRTEAASVRSEIAQRLAVAAAAVPAPAAPAVDSPIVPVSVAAVQPAIAVEEPTVGIAIVPPPLPPVMTGDIEPSAEQPLVASHVVAAAELPVAPALAAAPAVAVAETAPSKPGPSVTIKLPPARPVHSPAMEVEAKQVSPVPAAVRPAPVRSVAERARHAARKGPRLERLSMGEVALVTVDGPRWRAEPVSSSVRTATVRFVPLKPSTDVAEVRLLNAARVHRLAARTRAYLSGHGWRGIEIGDAESTRSRSIIYYPAGQRSVARKLSAQFGFAIAPHRTMRQVTVMLGRDSVRIAGARADA